ncbi:sugar kinase [Leisingera sp. XS_AS12]|uniref:sugar kinase n=1 Tax=Leisingera sp. XS_AS12 TaxID=3241294 RepID=UPI00351755E0
MTGFPFARVVAIGEAMVEMAPIGGDQYRRGFAGDTFNTAWHLSQTLADRATTAFASRIGTDPLSSDFAASLAADGLDTSALARDPQRTMGLYLIELDGVERSFHYWRGQSAARHLADDPQWLAQTFADTGLIHLSGITVAILSANARQNLLDALATARRHGTKVSFDPNIRPALWSSVAEVRETIPAFLEVTDIALPSFDDEQANWQDPDPQAVLDRMSTLGVREVVVKNGAGPVVLRSDDGDDSIDTPPVEGIRDTTGAGDAFNAGYLAARFLGHAPGAAVRHGQAMSAEVIRHLGARLPAGSVPRLPAAD